MAGNVLVTDYSCVYYYDCVCNKSVLVRSLSQVRQGGKVGIIGVTNIMELIARRPAFTNLFVYIITPGSKWNIRRCVRIIYT